MAEGSASRPPHPPTPLEELHDDLICKIHRCNSRKTTSGNASLNNEGGQSYSHTSSFPGYLSNPTLHKFHDDGTDCYLEDRGTSFHSRRLNVFN